MTKKESYDLIFSMGGACSCTSTLRALELQDFSYPFDWIGGLTLKERIELMLSGFKDWFHIEDFEKKGERLHPQPCDIYINNKTTLLYVHDFALHMPLEKSFPVVKARYDRRTSRLLKNIETAKKILIVYVEPPEGTNRYTLEFLKECHKLLVDNYKDKQFRIKYMYSTKDEPLYVAEDGVEIFAFDYETKKPDPQPGDFDEKSLQSKLKNVKLSRDFVTNIKRFLGKIFSLRIVKRELTTNVKLIIFGFKLQYRIKHPQKGIESV